MFFLNIAAADFSVPLSCLTIVGFDVNKWLEVVISVKKKLYI